MQVEERIRALGFSTEDARTLADHFLDAERRGKRGHGLARVDWLETLPGLDPSAEPECVAAEACYERWEGRGALGYLTLAAICAGQLEIRPRPRGWSWRTTASRPGCSATGRAASPPEAFWPCSQPPRRPGWATRREAQSSPETNPLPLRSRARTAGRSSVDVSMGRVTYGDVIAGAASEDELVPFGGEHAHKAFALAVGLQLLVDSLIGDGYGAVLLSPSRARIPFQL